MRLPAILLLLLAAACGRVGDPLPPFIRIPEPVKDLAVTQAGQNLVLTWTNPAHYVDGSTATNLTRVQIRSNSGAVAQVNVTAAGQPQSYAIPLNAATTGARTFSLIIETNQGKLSDVSNNASITPVDVPGRVARLTATPDQRRVFVKWQKPQDHPDLADAYVVVRSDFPTSAETVTETQFEDIRYQQGKTVTYQVTPVRRVAETTVMGVGPETVTITIEDKTPPSPPAGLAITASEIGAYLTWDANAETDLAGYRVFRSERADSDFKPLTETPVTTNLFIDRSARPGLYYAVSAVDEFGNESERSAPLLAP